MTMMLGESGQVVPTRRPKSVTPRPKIQIRKQILKIQIWKQIMMMVADRSPVLVASRSLLQSPKSS